MDRLGDLGRLTGTWAVRAREALEASRRLADRLATLEEREATRAAAASRADESAARAASCADEARALRATASALRDALGATRDELLEEIRRSERRSKEAREEREDRAAREKELIERVGAGSATVQERTGRVSEQDAKRRTAELVFRGVAERGLLAFVGVEPERAAEAWSYTDVLQLARRADEATGSIDCSPDARDRARDRVGDAQTDLTRGMRGEIRIQGRQIAGILEYTAIWAGRTQGVLELERNLDADVRSRDELLGKEENEIFEAFLSGETHTHLRNRLREASALVKRMNDQLAARPTSSGMRMRLKWEPGEESPTGTREAIDLLLRANHLLSEADRTALRTFLQQRLAEARENDGAGSLEERMMLVLDYRGWFQFRADFCDAVGTWTRLSRKTHGAGSGGQKAVMLHLPLFAAAAAFFESAAKTSLRLIALDEAFAGIDRPTRGQLMGLLAEFDLDFVMTSFEEWGFFPQLDGIATYHLARERGMRGVYAERFVWDGTEPRRA
ncbi:SbcC/MukB-like Walker B domain-containing protein [Vulgatibacter incomptus]|uniref:TIGR02680 family protein n=1 Tax=Vulgatibacter incomptus TaxID=1391653 RepID=A0A0K1PGW3_9BACT|nr:SbcC/MukB-like Walker B domain-containing protein [Vulgatibacter incomptus]AKU92737.1 Hypothetical protein AKJ08_3124 [Vulgatibacter incomptus]